MKAWAFLNCGGTRARCAPNSSDNYKLIIDALHWLPVRQRID